MTKTTLATSCAFWIALIFGHPSSLSAQQARVKGSQELEQWRHDIAFLREQMPKLHANPFHDTPRAVFDREFDDLQNRLPNLTSNQIKAQIMRIVALVQDGHTRVKTDSFGNHMLPVRLYFFEDGLYVISAEQRFAKLVGGKVLRFGSMRTSDVYAAVRPLIPVDKDNEYRRKLLAPDLMVTSEILEAIGATANSKSVEVTVEKDGREITATLPESPFRPWNNHGWSADPPGWTTLFSHVPTPLWLRHSDQNYWNEYLGDGRILYIQFNQVGDRSGGESIAQYFPRVLREAENKKVDQLILDLRLNGGGDNTLLRPIWHSILKSKSFNNKQHLWVLIGPKTFSAAMSLVDELELNTNAVFVGEPTGESPNQWGDPVDVKLPNSGIVVQLSTLWWQFEDPRDSRVFRAPDIATPLKFSDFAHGIDPALHAVENMTSQKESR